MSKMPLCLSICLPVLLRATAMKQLPAPGALASAIHQSICPSNARYSYHPCRAHSFYAATLAVCSFTFPIKQPTRLAVHTDSLYQSCQDVGRMKLQIGHVRVKAGLELSQVVLWSGACVRQPWSVRCA